MATNFTSFSNPNLDGNKLSKGAHFRKEAPKQVFLLVSAALLLIYVSSSTIYRCSDGSLRFRTTSPLQASCIPSSSVSRSSRHCSLIRHSGRFSGIPSAWVSSTLFCISRLLSSSLSYSTSLEICLPRSSSRLSLISLTSFHGSSLQLLFTMLFLLRVQ